MARLNSLWFKVFGWFWSSIALTIMVLLVISSVSFTDLVTKPLDKRKTASLEKYALFIEKRFNTVPTTRQLNQLVHRSSRKRVLFLKGTSPESSVLSGSISNKIDLNLLSEVDDMPPQYIFTENYHAFGPLKLSINNQQFKLYEVSLKRHPPLLIKFSLLPLWVKLSVPILVSLCLSFVFTRSIVRPIRALRTSADEIGKGNLSSRVPERFIGKDELGELSTDFNTMAGQLESLMGVQKRLLADISHELRSPLTRLSLAVGLAKESQGDKKDQYISRIEKEAEQLDQMIASVLMLSRLETQQQHLEMQEILLSDLITPILQDAEFEAESQNKMVDIESLPNVSLIADYRILASAIENIVRNAIRYAKTKVKISVSENEGHILIDVEDDGLGIPSHLIDKIQEPFFRHSDARERKSGGAGLGLAIAKKAIVAHSGSLTLQNKTSGGLLVSILLKSKSSL